MVEVLCLCWDLLFLNKHFPVVLTLDLRSCRAPALRKPNKEQLICCCNGLAMRTDAHLKYSSIVALHTFGWNKTRTGPLPEFPLKSLGLLFCFTSHNFSTSVSPTRSALARSMTDLLGGEWRAQQRCCCSQIVLFLFLQQRGGEMRDSRLPYGARHADRWGVHYERRPSQCLIHHDERSVRQLRGTEDDRCGRTGAAQDCHAQGKQLPAMDEDVRLVTAKIGLRWFLLPLDLPNSGGISKSSISVVAEIRKCEITRCYLDLKAAGCFQQPLLTQ